MISDILTESKLLDSIRTLDASHYLGVVQGPIFNGVDLFRLELIQNVPSVCTSFPDILSRRNAVEGFVSLFHKELHQAVKLHLEDCVRKKLDIDPSWIHGKVLLSKVVLLKKDQKEQQARLKRKAREDEAKKAKKLRVTYDPNKVDSSERREKRIRDSFHTTRSSHASSESVTRQVFTPP